MKAVNGKIIFDKEDVKLMCRVIIEHAEENIYGPEWQDGFVEHIFDNDFMFDCGYTARYYGGYYRPETYNRSYGIWEPAEYDEGELQFLSYEFDFFYDNEENEYRAEDTNISDFYDFINKELIE